MSKLLKKTFTVSVVALTIMWSVGVAALIPTVVNAVDCPVLVAGDLVMVNDKSSSAVWILDAGLKRIYFPNEDVYKTWYLTTGGKADWSLIKKVAPSCLETVVVPAAAPFGVNYFPGSTVLKLEGGTKYFVTEAGNKKSEITETAAAELFGSTWKSGVKTYSQFFSTWAATDGVKMETARLPDGSLVKKAAGDTYQVVSGKLSKVDSTLSGAAAKSVRTVSDTLFATGEVLTTTVTPASVTANPVQTTVIVTPGTPVVVAGGNLSVALAADTPAAGSAALSAIRLPFTKINLQNTGSTDVTVDSITVERQGYAVDASLSSIMLVDAADNSRIGLDQTLNSLHQVNFTDDMVIKAGVTKSLIVSGNIVSASHTGEAPKLSVVAVKMLNNATVSGALPLVGNSMTLVSLSTGSLSVARGSNDPGAAVTNKPLGTTGYIFTGLRLTAGANEDLSIESIQLYQAGSAASSDLKNVKVVLDGVEYVTTVSADGKYFTANFGGIALNKGLNKELYVKGDILTGASRTVRFDVYRRSDLIVKGKSYGFYVSPTGSSESGTAAAGAFSTSNPWYQGYLVTMAAGGSLRVDKGNLSASNISEGSTGQVLGNFNFVVDGEAVKITQLILTVDVSGTGSSSDYTNVTLYDSTGAAVAGPTDAADDSTALKDGTVTWSGTIVVPSGTNTYTVKGNLSTDFATNDTVRVGFTFPSTDITATGSDTGNSVTAAPASDVYGNLQTIKAGALTVLVSPVPVAQNLVKGTTDFVFAKYIFDASASGEDIRVSTFVPLLTVSANTYQTDVTSVRLYGYDGTTDGVQLNNGSNVKNPASAAATTSDETFTLDKPLIIPKGTSKTVELKGNVSATASGTLLKWGLTGTSTTYITAVGVSTGSAPTLTGATGAATPGAGSQMTLSAGGQFSIALDAGRPTGQLYIAGTTGNEVNRLRFTGTTEAISITNLRLKLNHYSASTSDQDIVKAYLYDTSGKLLADTTFSQGLADFTIPMEVSGNYNPFLIDKDSEKVMVVKLDLATVTTASTIGTAGHTVLVDYDYIAADTTKNQGKGASSGTTIAAYTADTNNTANIGYMFKGAPKFTKIDTTVFASGSAIYKFKVEADSRGGDIDLYQFTFQITTTSQTTGAAMYINQLDLVDVTTASEVTIVSSGTPGATGANTTLSGNDLDFVLRASPGTWTLSATPLTVAVGAPRTFELRATITGVGTGAALTTKLMGDSAYFDAIAATHMLPAATVFGGTYENFIWSDKSASGHAVGTSDWFNGFLVSGLPSSNLAPTVLSK